MGIFVSYQSTFRLGVITTTNYTRFINRAENITRREL